MFLLMQKIKVSNIDTPKHPQILDQSTVDPKINCSVSKAL